MGAPSRGLPVDLDSFGRPFGRYQHLGDKVTDAEGHEIRIQSVRPVRKSPLARFTPHGQDGGSVRKSSDRR